jgi:hypothetical protein
MGHLLRVRRRPSAAMVVAIVALIVAASGTAVAATQLVSGDSLIKKNSLSGNRLRNRSVAGGKIKLGSLGTVPKAAHASSADTATDATNATNATSASVSKVTYVAVTNSAIPPNENGGIPATLTATCPAGTIVTGGGASVTDQNFGFVNDSYPTGKTGWTADIFNANPPSPGTTIGATVTAICEPAASTAP